MVLDFSRLVAVVAGRYLRYVAFNWRRGSYGQVAAKRAKKATVIPVRFDFFGNPRFVDIEPPLRR